MARIYASILFALFFCTVALGAPETGQPLPVANIADKGELFIVGDDIEYRPWSTERLKGRWTLLQYMAARPKASEVNRHVVDAVAAKQGEGVDIRVLNIINVRDVTFGATGFAMRELKKNKFKYPETTLIADMDSARQLWDLQKKGSSIFLLDDDNTVVYFKDGIVSDAELTALLAMLPAPASENGSTANAAE